MKLGFDIGGSKIAPIGQSNEGGVKEYFFEEVKTPTSYPDFLCAIEDIYKTASKIELIDSVGVSIAGIRRQEVILANNLPFLTGQTVQKDLSNLLNCSVEIANDADCFALAEAQKLWEKDKTAQRVLGLIIGTGLGAGLVVDQKLSHGVNGCAGEVGQIPLDWHGIEIDKPLYQPAEKILSGPAFEQEFASQYGLFLSAIEISSLLAEGKYPEFYQSYCDRLARFLAGVINFWDPSHIVIGGGLMHLPNLKQSVQEKLGSYVLLPPVQTKLSLAQLGSDGGKYGALLL